MAGPSPVSVLRNRNFRLYWSGQAVSLVGTWMQVMGQGFVVATLSNDAWALGAFNVLGSLPMLVLGARGGQAADRGDKRVILLWTQAAMMLLAFAFAGLLYAGLVTLWVVFALAIAASVVEAFEFPASQGLGPELVEPRDIPSAVALMQTIHQGGRLLGPAAAGYLIARFGEASAFAANGVSFLAVIAALVLMKRPPPASAGGSGPMPRFREGWTHVRQDRVTFLLFLVLVLTMVLVFPFMVILPHYILHVLLADAQGLGNVLSASGVGALAGTLLMLRADPDHWRPRLIGAVVAVAASLLVMSGASGLPVALAGNTGLSAAMAVLMGTVNATVQHRVPPELRGRVSAVFGMAFTSVLPFAALVVSAAADIVGVRALMAVCPMVFALVTLAGLAATRGPAAHVVGGHA